MTKKELALEYHKKGYNCTQAVACAFCGEFGVSEEEMYKIAEGFGTAAEYRRLLRRPLRHFYIFF